MAETLIGHKDRIINIGYDPIYLYSSSKDKTIRIWNVQTQQCTHVLKGFSHSPRISVDEKYLYAISNNELSVWAKRSWTQIYHEVLPTGSDLQDVIHDEKHLYTSVRDGRIFIIEKDSFSLKHEIQAHAGGIWSIAQDDGHLYSASVDTTIKIWHKARHTLQHTLTGHNANIQAMCVNDHAIYSFSTDKVLSMWDKSSGELLGSLKKVFKKGLIGVFCHQRFVLATSAAEGIKFLATTSLEPVATVEYNISNGKAVAINGDMLYLGLTNHSIRIVHIDDLLADAQST
jgi:F-box and WD-40 domain protein 1/11